MLLLEFDALATEAGWATSEVVEVGSQPDFRLTFARMAARLLRSISLNHNLKGKVERAFSVVESFSVGARLPGGFQLKHGVQPARGVADSGDPEEDLSDLVREIGEVARAGNLGALFLIDEMQNLDERSLAAICPAFQNVNKRELPVALVAAGLPDLPRRLFGAKPYADRLFSNQELGRLPAPAARSAIIGPAALLGVKFDEAVAELVISDSAGYPYFIQEYGRELWNYAEESPIRVADVTTVREVVGDSLARDFFGTRFGLATDAEQKYLSAMASLGDGPYRSRDVASAYGVADQRRVSIQRDGLLRKGLVWSPRRAFVDFTVPLFAPFLRDNHPLESFDQGG